MKREKRLTKRERKALSPQASPAAAGPQHIHCIACGRHLDEADFSGSPPIATTIICKHQGAYPCCVNCTVQAQVLVDTHDRSGQPVQAASAWH